MRKLLVAGLLALSFSGHGYTKSIDITLRNQTQREAFLYATTIINALPWFQENNYKIGLPSHATFTEFSSSQKKISGADLKRLETIFANEIYQESDFTKGLEELNQYQDLVCRSIEKLVSLQEKWGFKLLPKYEVLLSLYGPGGFYEETNGHIIMRTDKNGNFSPYSYIEQPAGHTLLYFIVLVGIDHLVKKFNLTHWEKIILVGLICSRYLELPGYEMQTQQNDIDRFITLEDIILNLPLALEAYVSTRPDDCPANRNPLHP